MKMGSKGEHQEILQSFFCCLLMLIFLFLREGKVSNLAHILAVLSPNFPPYFFAGIRACANMHFRPNTSVGNADRSISRRSARTLNNASDRDVLCEERYENVEWGNGWVLFVRVENLDKMCYNDFIIKKI